MEYINWIANNTDVIFGVLSGVLAVALIIVKVTPNTKDDEIVEGAQAVLQKVAGFFKPKA